MKILLLGEYTSRFWSGSATEKVQKAVLSVLSAHSDVLLYNYRNKVSFFHKFFLREKISEVKEGRLLNCGLFSYSLLKNLLTSKVVHILVLRKYLLFLIPVLFLIRKKVVFTIHDTLLIQKRSLSFNHLLFLILVKLSSMIFVYSEYDKRILKRYKSVAAISLIRNGINNPHFDYIEKLTDKFKILFSGGFGNPIKGLDFLLSALEKIKYDYSLLICGQNIRQKDNIQQSDYIGELNPLEYFEILKSVDLVVVPSSYESFSLTALESLSYGIPLILTRQCGMSKYITDRQEALIVEYGNEHELTEAIIEIISNSILRKKIIKNGLRLAEEFQWDRIILQDYLPNYRKVFNAK